MCSCNTFLNHEGSAKQCDSLNKLPIWRRLNACLSLRQRHSEHVKAYWMVTLCQSWWFLSRGIVQPAGMSKRGYPSDSCRIFDASATTSTSICNGCYSLPISGVWSCTQSGRYFRVWSCTQSGDFRIKCNFRRLGDPGNPVIFWFVFKSWPAAYVELSFSRRDFKSSLCCCCCSLRRNFWTLNNLCAAPTRELFRHHLRICLNPHKIRHKIRIKGFTLC